MSRQVKNKHTYFTNIYQLFIETIKANQHTGQSGTNRYSEDKIIIR